MGFTLPCFFFFFLFVTFLFHESAFMQFHSVLPVSILEPGAEFPQGGSVRRLFSEGELSGDSNKQLLL